MSVTSKALWTWDTTDPTDPQLVGFTNGSLTKTGLMPPDLQAFVGVPLQYYNQPATVVASGVVLGWIRSAEDWVEQATTVLLCPTWIAGPPAPNDVIAINLGLTPTGFGQRLGIDYDLADAPFDFIYQKNMNEGWGITQSRYRPLRNLTPQTDRTALKLYSFFYPLLSDYFQVPPSWYQEDQDFGVVRLVPAENVQMLPLWAMQIAFMGYAESVPGAIWTQYTCGLTPNDYRGRFSFMKQLVLCQAAVYALQSIQGTINMGLMRHSILEDGVQYQAQYSEKGPFGSLIDRFETTRDDLLQMAQANVSGPMFITI